MADYTLYYWPVPFRGQFIRAILAHAGKMWNEPDDVGEMTGADPDKQPVPFMGPPVLIEKATGFKLSEMTAIAYYLGETLGLLPTDAQSRAMTIKVVADANDVIDDMTNDGGREMWTAKSWKDYKPRLKRWMTIFEVVGQQHHLKADKGFLLGTDDACIADIVTATLWGTMRDRFPAIGDILRDTAPLVAALTDRMMATRPLEKLLQDSNAKYGDVWCGGEIEKSLRQVVKEAAHA